LLCDSPQVQDAVGRADAILNAGRAYRSAMITELWNTVASGKRDDTRAARPLPVGLDLHRRQRARRWTWCTGMAAASRSSAKAASPNAGATLHTVGQTVTLAPEWYPIGGRVYLGLDPGPRLR
jgi:hypothetical protein